MSDKREALRSLLAVVGDWASSCDNLLRKEVSPALCVEVLEEWLRISRAVPTVCDELADLLMQAGLKESALDPPPSSDASTTAPSSSAVVKRLREAATNFRFWYGPCEAAIVEGKDPVKVLNELVKLINDKAKEQRTRTAMKRKAR